MKFEAEYSRAAGIFLMFLVVAAVAFSQDAVIERIMPSWSADARVIEVTASESLVINPFWNKCEFKLEQAEGVTEKFRVAVGTTTVSLDLPLRDSFSISAKGPILLAVQTSTDTAKLVMTQARAE